MIENAQRPFLPRARGHSGSCASNWYTISADRALWPDRIWPKLRDLPTMRLAFDHQVCSVRVLGRHRTQFIDRNAEIFRDLSDILRTALSKFVPHAIQRMIFVDPACNRIHDEINRR